MDLLINLDSPATKQLVKYNSRSPLIPSRIPINIDSPNNNNNPFDEVVNVVGKNQQPHDPFDIVLQASLQGNSSNQQETNQNAILNKTFDKDTKNIKQKKKTHSLSLTEETSINLLKINVKEFVSKRITSCIERTINTSLSQVDLTKASNNSSKQFRRSFSAGMLRTTTNNNADLSTQITDLNVSTPVDVTQTLSKETTLGGTFTYESSSPDLPGQSDRTFNFEDIKLSLKNEAKKLSEIISKVKFSSQVGEKPGNSSTDSCSEDLFDVRPPWESEDMLSDEEQDSVGLPKLKIYRDSFNGFNTTFEEEAIKKFIKRRSIDWEQSEETTRCQDITKPTIESFSPDASSSMVEDTNIKNEMPTIQIEPNLMSEIVNKNQLRFIKKTGNEIPKKGPLKAFVPIQKMSKNLTSKLSQLKSKSQQVTTNNKDETLPDSDIRPVAASTPTKSHSATGVSSTIKRRNNAVSPTGRKTRSSSVEVIERNKGNELSGVPKASTQKVKKTEQEEKESVSRPQSAPDKSTLEKLSGNFSRAALKALGSRPVNRATATGGRRLKMKSPVTLSAQDKENQVIVKK